MSNDDGTAPILPQFFRCRSLFTQGSQAQTFTPLCEPLAILIHHERTMKKPWCFQSERPIKQKLPRRRKQQIFAPHHLGNFHGRIVHHTGQLIGRNVIVPPHDKIPEIFSGNERFLAKILISKCHRFAIGRTEAPGKFCAFDLSVAPAGSGINRLFVIRRVRRLGGRLNVPP